MAKSYYALLGITSRASHDDIKTAYRRLAKQFHPDMHSGTSDLFLDIQEAYSVLGDRSQRRAYDDELLRVRASRQSAGTWPEPPASSVRERHPADLDDVLPIRSFDTFRPTLDEVFAWLWRNFRGLTCSKAEAVRNLTLDFPITPRQAREGGHARILAPATAICPVCQGEGGVGYYECIRCAGEGRMHGAYPLMISYPAGLMQDHTVLVALDRFGIHNTYLTVRFRLTEEPVEV